MTYDELEVKHKGKTYFVSFRINSTKEIDDSFDGHRDGYVYTFEAHHYEVDDFDVLAVCDDEGDEIDSSLVPGLDREINNTIKEIEIDEEF